MSVIEKTFMSFLKKLSLNKKLKSIFLPSHLLSIRILLPSHLSKFAAAILPPGGMTIICSSWFVIFIWLVDAQSDALRAGSYESDERILGDGAFIQFELGSVKRDEKIAKAERLELVKDEKVISL